MEHFSLLFGGLNNQVIWLSTPYTHYLHPEVTAKVY